MSIYLIQTINKIFLNKKRKENLTEHIMIYKQFNVIT